MRQIRAHTLQQSEACFDTIICRRYYFSLQTGSYPGQLAALTNLEQLNLLGNNYVPPFPVRIVQG